VLLFRRILKQKAEAHRKEIFIPAQSKEITSPVASIFKHFATK
jgi:hypothetical protein